jgi:CheY-like chemotaxis protein
LEQALATILVVDDDAVNRLLLATILEPRGHAVLECADGGVAIAALDDCSADLIIVDMQMPHVDGLELIKRLRRDRRHDRTAVLLYTATPEDKALRNVADAYGVRGILAKPSDPRAVIGAVDAALSDGPGRSV